MQRIIYLFLFITLGCSTLSAQTLTHVLGEVLVRPAAGQEIKTILADFDRFEGQATKLSIVEEISRPLNIWRLHFDHTAIHEQRFLRHLQANNKIHTAQLNHLVTMRETIPNDALFDNQWQYINQGQNGGTVGADIDADLAWDITTGGLTIDGDTIVVAVLDDGIDRSHEDFGDNLWLNHAEIPDNGIDDDNNGYIDDYLGWNINSNNDNIEGGGHGTPVAGIVGAQGDNNIGVAGVNWNVKIMVIRTDFNTNEADVIEAYSYVLEARQKYNESNGSEGAFVVSTNASWGIDFGQPENSPLWCAFYDTLGQAGILNCGATINGNQNVDEIGDLPTACPSDFMVSVTNMNRNDVKVTQAGYGAETIDLGAFGAETFTTADNNGYSGFGGTSGATPHVTGAIALLYSAPCSTLSALAKSNPAEAALLARQYILEGVDPNASLDTITTTGGRLNLYNSLSLLLQNCSPCPPPVALAAEAVTDTSANLVWTVLTDSTAVYLRWRTAGDTVWVTADSVSSPFALNNLSACTDYEFQLSATCDTLDSDSSSIVTFRTDGCCLPPSGLSVTNIGMDSASISWSTITAATTYNVLLSSPTGTILYEQVASNELDVFDLLPCETYSVSVQTNCTDSSTVFGTPITFTTFGCGACLDLTYCESSGANSNFEWIESIVVGPLSNTSGDDGGYILFDSPATVFTSYNTYPVTLTPAFSGITYAEYFKIWIDFNHDGVFDPVSELAFDGLEASAETITGSMLIPGTAMTGITRMRIGMEWEGGSGTEIPEPCDTYDYGEVEDYCIEIVEGAPMQCDTPTNPDTLNTQPGSITLSWMDASDDHVDHNLRVRMVDAPDWTLYENVASPLEITDLEDCMNFEFQVQANCADGVSKSEFTESFEFSSYCVVVSTNDLAEQFEISVLPNPFREELVINLEGNVAGTALIQLVDLSGRILHQQSTDIFSGRQSLLLDNLSDIPDGVYVVSVQTENGTYNQKLVKMSR